MRIFDGFLFNDELDLLELRLMELGDLVDHFLIVEGRHDFQQHPKRLVFMENRKRFARWNDKIIHQIVKLDPAPHPFIEHESRRQFDYAGADFNDLIMLGDVDEIPSREALELVRKTPPGRPMVLQQHLYYYRVTNHAGWWNGTIVMPRGLGRMDWQQMRDMRNQLPVLPVKTGGWHFSWLGDADQVREKLRCLDVKSDNDLYGSELPDIPDPDTDAAKIERTVAIGDDLFGRERKFQTMVIEPGVLQPSCIHEWLDGGRERYA